MLQYVRRRWLELALVLGTVNLAWLVYASATALEPGEVRSQRNSNFPDTYISQIHLDLTAPNQYVTLTWNGSAAGAQATGPFHSSPGSGWGTNDCNDAVESNCPGSQCTPKGLRKVEGFADHLPSTPEFRYVTYIDQGRMIGFHSSGVIPPYPDSMGCVRLEARIARVIHDNSIVGKTEILIDGTWTNPAELKRKELKQN